MHDPKHLKETSSLVDGALTDSVRQNHWTLLGAFRDWLDAHPLMVPRALQETAAYFMQELGYLRDWQWQTLHRSMCSLVGAMSNAPLYSNLPHSVSLNSVAPHYRAALSTANQHAQQSQPHGQAAVALDHIIVAVEEEPRLWARVALLLMWLTGARVGCVLQLRVEDVVLDSEGNLSLSFAHGKGVRLRGPYTTGTSVTGEWQRAGAAVPAARCSASAVGKEDQLLFPATEETIFSRRMARLLAAIRVAHPALNLRAMRRGSLQTVSASGLVPMTAVMDRAGHTNIRTTRRYHDFGRADVEALRQGALMAAALLPASR